MEVEMVVTEAFVPSGTELPDVSHGLFTGDDSTIKEWVASGTWCRPHQVSLVKRQVRAVTQEGLSQLKEAQAALLKAQTILNSARENDSQEEG
jgi:hypothetical protein